MPVRTEAPERRAARADSEGRDPGMPDVRFAPDDGGTMAQVRLSGRRFG
jgi:hypothetical protein